MKNIFSKLLLLLLFTSFSLFASPTHPPLIKQGESYDDIANFTIGGGHSGIVNSVAFSPDEKFIVSGSWDNSVKLWSVEDKNLFADIYSIGANWVWFDDVNKTLLRVDDGSLLWDQNSSQSKIPKNSTSKDDLDIKIPKEIDIYSQKQSTIEANLPLSLGHFHKEIKPTLSLQVFGKYTKTHSEPNPHCGTLERSSD